MTSQSKRLEQLAQRPVRRDIRIKDLPQAGLCAMTSPYDPKPSLVMEHGRILELDGKKRESFDCVERMIADHALDLSAATEAMNLSSASFAQKLLDLRSDVKELRRLAGGMTPAKLCEVVRGMNPVELMMASQRLKECENSVTQCLLGNAKDDPVLLACDAAEAALRGFSEEYVHCTLPERTPLCLLSAFVGAQCARPGVLTYSTQPVPWDSGLSQMAAPVRVHGSESIAPDVDATPYSDLFLASVYASRGMKTRSATGAGSEAKQGKAEQKSMLYLQCRSFLVTKACGIQGTDYGALRCDGLVSSVSAGLRELLCEQVLVQLLGLESVSGGMGEFTHSDLRKSAGMLLQMLSGGGITGYGMAADYDLPGAGFHAEDMEDCLSLQRDLQLDAGLSPVSDAEVLKVRENAARCLQQVFRFLDFPEITDEQVCACAAAHGSQDVSIQRNAAQDVAASRKIGKGEVTVLDLVKALEHTEWEDTAQMILAMAKQRLSGDSLHTAAFLDQQLRAGSSIDHPNQYQGPGTGPQTTEERWEELQNLSHVIDPSGIDETSASV